jgi:hypothetical protein
MPLTTPETGPLVETRAECKVLTIKGNGSKKLFFLNSPHT